MGKKRSKSPRSRKRPPRHSVRKRARKPARGRVRSVRPRRFAHLSIWVPPEPESKPEPVEPKLKEVLNSKELLPVTAPAIVSVHLDAGCPYCLAVQSGGLPPENWPEPCTCRVSVGQGLIVENVRCFDSANARLIGHHWSCPYWDHTDGVPF
jgi:hypothetical protein